MTDEPPPRLATDADHQAALVDVLAVSDATDEQLSELYAEASRVSGHTPHSTTDLLRAAEDFAKRGTDAERLWDSVMAAVEFAQFEDTDLLEAVRVVSVVRSIDRS